MRVPTVHMNGTGKDDLLEQLETAGRALMDATKALRMAHPNGRDYYIHGDDAFGEARDEHASRQNRLGSVLDEIKAIHMAVADGNQTGKI